MALTADVVVMAGALVLLLGGFSKIVQPRPIAGTLASLWNRVTGQAHAGGSPVLGWLLGAGEVVLAAAMVLHRSWTTGAALALFALGLSAAGTIGVMSGERLPCACFGKSDRALGYPHIVQLPLWLAVAWSVAREPWMFDAGTGLKQGLAMLAACAACSTAVQVASMWRAVFPMALQRRRRALEPADSLGRAAGGSSW